MSLSSCEQGAKGERQLANGRSTFALKLYSLFLPEMIYPTSNNPLVPFITK
jgi:hypothetical protein